MNKIALITGASAGIGRSLAYLLAENGWHLGIMARRKEVLDEMARDLNTKHPECRVATRVLDVRDTAACESVVKALGSELGGIDLFIANAGIGWQTPAWKNHSQMILDILQTNVMGAIATIEAAKDFMLANKSGHIVGISSVAGFRGMPTSSAYSTSKVAFTGYLEAIRLDLRHLGISVTSIHPGYIDTFMTQKNKYKMPFIMPADKAADLIYTAITKRKARYIFPWQMKILITILRLMPDWLYDFILSRPVKGVTR